MILIAPALSRPRTRPFGRPSDVEETPSQSLKEQRNKSHSVRKPHFTHARDATCTRCVAGDIEGSRDDDDDDARV